MICQWPLIEITGKVRKSVSLPPPLGLTFLWESGSWICMQRSALATWVIKSGVGIFHRNNSNALSFVHGVGGSLLHSDGVFLDTSAIYRSAISFFTHTRFV